MFINERLYRQKEVRPWFLTRYVDLPFKVAFIIWDLPTSIFDFQFQNFSAYRAVCGFYFYRVRSS